MQTVAIVPCLHGNAYEGLVCGLPRRERLIKTLHKKGFRTVDDPAAADRVLEDCTVLVGNDELSLCTHGLATVEDRLIASLTKPTDGPISRHINRKVSTALTRRLMNTRVKPNHVTTFTLLLGIASGIVVAFGGYWAGVLGAALLQTQSVLDGTDGELSRLRFQGSKLGEWLDTLSDDLSNLSFLAGASLVASVAWVHWMGLAACAVFVLTQAVIYYYLATVYRSGNLQVFQWKVGDSWGGPFARIEFLFKRDFFCLLFLFLALIDLLEGTVVLFSIGVFLTALTLARLLITSGQPRPPSAS